MPMILRMLPGTLALLLTAQNISVSDPATSWITTVPEPPIPNIAAGQSYTSWFGHKVTRVTDSRTGDGGSSWMHYYSDRSPFNKDSTFLVMYNQAGAIWVQPIDRAIPKGRAFLLTDVGRGPRHLGLSMWSPIDKDLLYVIGDFTKLWTLNATTKSWKMIRDFSKDLTGLPKDGYLKIQFVSQDGNRMIFDYNIMAKEAHAILAYDVPKNAVRAYKGRNLAKRSPEPNASFKLAGAGGADKEGDWISVQENGTPTSNGSSPDPLENANTLTFLVPWAENLLGSGYAIAGRVATGHGASMSHGHVRVTSSETGRYIGGVDWLNALRLISTQAAPNPADQGRIPYEDLFYWPGSYGMTGVHLSASGPSDWLALSLYQESSCDKRLIKPLANEILMVSSQGRAVHDQTKHSITSNGVFRRIAHHYSYPEDCGQKNPYWGQPRAAISMDGKYVVYTSSFGRTGRLDVFAITLPTLP